MNVLVEAGVQKLAAPAEDEMRRLCLQHKVPLLDCGDANDPHPL